MKLTLSRIIPFCRGALIPFSKHNEWSGYVNFDLLTSPLKGKDAGDHSPITPMVATYSSEFHDSDAAKLYNFIVRHFISTVRQTQCGCLTFSESWTTLIHLVNVLYFSRSPPIAYSRRQNSVSISMEKSLLSRERKWFGLASLMYILSVFSHPMISSQKLSVGRNILLSRFETKYLLIVQKPSLNHSLDLWIIVTEKDFRI
jgi:hypothetical protein